MTTPHKWILSAVFLFSLLLSQLSPVVAVAHAQAALPGVDATAVTTPGNPTPGAGATQVDNVAGGTLTVESIQNAINAPTPNLANTTAYVFYTISVLMTGTFDPTYNGTQPSQQVSQGQYPRNISQAVEHGGAIGGMAYLMAELYTNKPASAQVYVADLIQNSRFTGEKAYAQGVGFGALSPILGTWKAFRDVAYYLITIMFLVTGFLILIRHKVSGNVAVTVQNALPKLVVTLILITFSYAIAGLVVDLMFLALYFIINLFSGRIFQPNAMFSLGLGAQNKSLSDLAFNTHIFSFMIGYVFNTGNASAWGAASSVGNIVYQALTNALSVTPVLDQLKNGALGSFFNAIINIVFTIIFGVALLIAMFRTFFALIMSYAGFVINVVMSPFILLGGAIPGNDPFMNWFKNLLAGLAPFVVAVFMIFMALALTGSQTRAGIGYAAPDLVGGNSVLNGASNSTEITGLRLPLILAGELDASAFVGVLAMGFMLLLPEAVNMTKNLVGAKGGIFDSFKEKAVSNFQKGWTGNNFTSGKGIVQGAGRAAAGAGIGAIVGAGAGKQMADQKKLGTLGRVGYMAGGSLAGLTSGAAILGPGVSAYKAGKPMYDRFRNYQTAIDKVQLAAAEELRKRRSTNVMNAAADNTKAVSQQGEANVENGGLPTMGAG